VTRALLVVLAVASIAGAAELPVSEFQARRAEALRRLPDGILLVRSRSFQFHGDQDYLAGYQQDPNFFYLTGLSSAAGAMLAIDGASKETWLFVPQRLTGVASMMPNLLVTPGADTAKSLGLDRVVERSELSTFLVRREEVRRSLVLYVPGARGEPASPIAGALDDPGMAWSHVLGELWPAARIHDGTALLTEMRLVKSPAEVEVLRRVGMASAAALRAGIGALSPGRPQREAEARVVTACIAAGAEGPSFWPWIMTGDASAFPAPLASLGDYRHLNRVMRAGDVARVDVGCDLDHYKGDVGRTAPVSGRFDPGQRETWELLVAAYRAGLAVFRDGAKSADVFAASLAEVRRRQPTLATPLGRKSAETLLGPDGLGWWEIHGVGLDSAEGMPEVLRAGMTVDFEPIFSVDGQGFYLEDMILVTPTGHEILTPGLPYTADEIERAVRAGTR
jgi:Xaa-Pro aminopeptidase